MKEDQRQDYMSGACELDPRPDQGNTHNYERHCTVRTFECGCVDVIFNVKFILIMVMWLCKRMFQFLENLPEVFKHKGA